MRAILLLILLASIGCQSSVIVRGPNQNVDEIMIEIDYTTDAPPSQALLNAIKGHIENICSPGMVVTFIVDDHLDGHGTWTDYDCREFTVLHKSNLGTFYMIFAGGQHDESNLIGGVSWDKRNFAVFPDVTGLGGGAQIAAVHEWLHSLGLVGDWLKMQTPHRVDPGHHCASSPCIMSIYGTSTIPCPLCIADLEAGEEQ